MWLEVQSGRERGKRLKIDRDGVIGRDLAADYPVLDPTVSRRHAEIVRSADGWRLRDLGSSNGTELNGSRLIGDRPLRGGDILALGQVRIVCLPDEPAEERRRPTVEGSAPECAAALDDDCGDRIAAAVLRALSVLPPDAGAETEAHAALLALIQSIPGARKACLVDWKAGRIMARAPAEAEISRSKVFLALEILRQSPEGVVAWSAASCAAVSVGRGTSALPPLIVLPVDAAVGVLVEGPEAADLVPESGLNLRALSATARLMRIPLAALRAAAAASSRKLRDSDLRLAQRIQQRLLAPTPAVLEGFELAVSYRPAMMVGGDFYHIACVGAELAMLIGDVSGKGVSGAMYMAYLMAELRHQLKNCKSPGELLEQLHRSLSPVLEIGMFITVAVVFVHLKSGMARVALAGHSAPVLRTAAGKVIEMGLDPGAPLGADPKLNVREQKLQLAPGDCLLLTTDGVEEGENAQGEQFGKARRDQVLLSCATAAETNETLRRELLEFVGRDRSTDDLTIICLSRTR